MLDTNLTPFEYDNMASITNCHLVCAEKSFVYKTSKFKFYDITKKDGKVNPELKPAAVESLDIATMSFTSGSTGVPKVVPLTHFNIVECTNSLESMAEWIRPGDFLYGFLPMYHVFGFAVEILATLHFGAGVLLQPTVNPKEIMADFKKFRPQIIPAVPRLWEVFRNKIIDNVKAQKKWWLVSFILKYGNILQKKVDAEGNVSYTYYYNNGKNIMSIDSARVTEDSSGNVSIDFSGYYINGNNEIVTANTKTDNNDVAGVKIFIEDQYVVKQDGIWKLVEVKVGDNQYAPVLYVDKYIAFLKIPSEVIEKFYYDVVIEFSPPNLINKLDKSLENYNVKFFSNDPAFVFTFAYAFNKNKLFITDLEQKMSKEALEEKAKIKNPNASIGYVKSLYFAYLYLKSKGLFLKNMYETYGKPYNQKYLLQQTLTELF